MKNSHFNKTLQYTPSWSEIGWKMFQLLHCAKSQTAAIHQLASMNMQACFSPTALYHKIEWLIIILHAITQHLVFAPPFLTSFLVFPLLAPDFLLVMAWSCIKWLKEPLETTKLRPHLGAHMGKFKVMLPFEYINSIRGSQVLKWSDMEVEVF